MTDKNIAAIRADIKCADGKKAELAVLSDRIEATAKAFGVFPKKLWSYTFPASAESVPKEVLDIAIDAVKEATSLKDLEVLLKYNADKALRAYFSKPEAAAEENAETEAPAAQPGAEPFDPAQKKTLSQAEFQKMETVVVAYAKVLERLGKETLDKYHAGFYPISYLPYPKEKIRSSLQTAITHTTDPKMAENLRGLEKFLDHFIDDKMARKRNTKAKEETPGVPPAGGIPGDPSGPVKEGEDSPGAEPTKDKPKA